MIYNDLIDDIKSADYVLFGLGKEIYSSDDTEIYDNLKKLFASMEHVNYFIVSTEKAGTIRNCGLNERRIVCPVNEKMAESRIKLLSSDGHLKELSRLIRRLRCIVFTVHFTRFLRKSGTGHVLLR